MATPTKQEQEAEARARAESGVDPAENVAALDVIDDVAGTDGQSRPTTDQPEQRPPQVKSPYDGKRADIVARFRTTRTEDADAARDDISDFARSGMPPEFEPEATAAAVEPTVGDQDEPAGETKPQTVRLKVRGKEIELPLEEVIANAQMNLAADNYLDEAKGKLKDADTLLRELREKAQRAGQPEPHQVRANGAQTEDQPSGDETAGDPDITVDPLDKLIETLQFGDPTEARTLLRDTIATEANKAVTTNMQTARLRDEAARSQKVLLEFLSQHADIAEDPRAKAVVEYNLYEQQLEDFKELGIDPSKFRTAHGGPPTSGDIAQAHLWYRGEGFRVKTPTEMMEKAIGAYKTWKGITPEPAADPARTTPRVDLSIDRSLRRQAIPQQPERTAAPRPGGDQPAAAQPRDRSAIVASMRNARDAPRGKVAIP